MAQLRACTRNKEIGATKSLGQDKLSDYMLQHRLCLLKGEDLLKVLGFQLNYRTKSFIEST